MNRRTLILGLVSVVGLLAVAEGALAFFWCRKCDRHKTVIVCRPYNAFTPICAGRIDCNGCCPTNFCSSPCHAPMLPSFQPWCGMPAPSCDPCCMPGGPGLPALPTATPPPPLAGPVTMNGMPNIYQASYQPMYYPNYYPMPNYYPGYYPMGYTNYSYPMMPMQPYGGYGYPGYGYPGYGR